VHCSQRVGYAFTSDRFVNTTSQRTRPYSRFAPAVSRLLIGVAETAVAAAAAAAMATVDCDVSRSDNAASTGALGQRESLQQSVMLRRI